MNSGSRHIRPRLTTFMKNFTLSIFVCALAACATPEPAGSPGAGMGTTGSADPAGAQVAGAATAPLSDLNLVRAEIPPALRAAQKGAYMLPDDSGCETLGRDVQALDAVLGPDLDAPVTPSNPGMIERGAGAVGTAAVDALRGAAEGVVPFRGWVRKLTGAERYSKEVAAAIAAGTVRRAFLKGLGQARGCEAPAAPRH
jgi:hypothetical protein